MRLKKLIIENFKCYKERVEIDINQDLTALIGKNDVGKSTIFQALDIFFNDSKVERIDKNVFSDDDKITFGCVFDNIPDEIVIDSSSKTNLNNEYLLNAEGDLEIYKEFDSAKSKISFTTYIYAWHPLLENDECLHNKKNTELKTIAKSKEVSDVDKRKNPELRRMIWQSFDNLSFQNRKIICDKDETKDIYEKLKEEMPLFALFNVDKQNTDQDSEIQDPMKLAIKQAINEINPLTKEIENKVKTRVSDVATKTLEKLKTFDEKLADQLTPDFNSDPKWEGLFKLNIVDQDQIPINKRGSGVRRLILISFFMAEQDRKIDPQKERNIIYAIEEPETSQHPANQEKIINVLLGLSKKETCQVLISTHVPGIAGLLPLDSIRFLSCDEMNNRIISQAKDNNASLVRISSELGILPNPNIRLLFYLEGPNDIIFLENMYKIFLKDRIQQIPELFSDNSQVIFIPLGGGNLQHWVQRDYLSKINAYNLYLFDKDPDSKYQKQVDELNQRANTEAMLTRKLMMENYLHTNAIYQFYGFHVDVEDDKSIIDRIKDEKISKGNKDRTNPGNIKEDLNCKVARLMTIEMLRERDAFDEIYSWFKKIGVMLNQ